MVVLRRHLVLAAGLAGITLPAQAQVPDAVREMFDTAVLAKDARTLETVAKVAKETWPDDVEAIDALLDRYKDRHEELAERRAAKERARIRQAGILDEWKGEGEFGAFRATGNTSNLGIAAGLTLKRDGVDWENQLRLRADYQRDSGEVTREQYLAAYSPRYKLGERLYSFGLAQYERDRFQGYRGRYTLSGGLGYRVIKRKGLTLSLEGGPAWRRTQVIDEPDEDNWSALGSLDFDWKVGKTVKLTQDASIYVDEGNSTLTSATGLEAAMSKALKARLSYTVEHETSPPPDALDTDTLSRFTLIFGF
ncbi:hypothetical protein B2G71_18870 [Novosphingobium sp. PC22D]|uniref:DUF481 domain-containing protein n=1 Tax=Novosphingobium sp. PC22D TaxID=1962403 RepID=UPI000BF00D70|nr:DUF481 domain-containing protein [Novosphingobium sp. PC22D]PEQ11103.1 hypothetical protein B2G71_18870 [Novosphingobium sp. PC22D]